jgi:hypothetical protein
LTKLNGSDNDNGDVNVNVDVDIDDTTLKKVPIAFANWLCNDLFALVIESAMNKEDNIPNGDNDASPTSSTLVQFVLV